MNNFIILTNGRSGSNYLVDVINQHPLLFNYGEVLGPWSRKRKIKSLLRLSTEEKYLDFIFKSKTLFYFSQFFYFLKDKKNFKFKNRQKIVQVGIKDFGIHIDRYNLQKWLVDNSHLKVIHLYRENQLDRYLSLHAMKSTGLVSTKAVKSTSKIQVDCNDLLETLQIYEAEMHFQFQLADSLDSNRLITISYEELFLSDNKSEIISSMFGFLGVPDIEIVDRHKRILSQKISEKVENYDELCEVLKHTQFEKYLN